jgi:hypothetical protein
MVTTWENRLQPRLGLISPSTSATFAPRWLGDEIKGNRRIALFNFPDRDGTLIQDLGIQGDTIPLTFYFEGINCDIEAMNFRVAAKEKGNWTVLHPVESGEMILQLISYTVDYQPVSSGNIIKVTTEWIKPLDKSEMETLETLSLEIIALQAVVNDAVITQIRNTPQIQVDATKPSWLDSLKSNWKAFSNFMAKWANTIEGFSSYITEMWEGILAEVSQPFTDLASIATSVQHLLQMPMQAIGEVTSKFRSFSLIFGSIGSGLDSALSNLEKLAGISKTSSKAIWGIHVNVDIFSAMHTSAMVGCSRAAITGSINTRSDAISCARQLQSFSDSMTTKFEAIQESFATLGIEAQFFYNSDAYYTLMRMTALTQRYLYRRAFDLSVERIIVLDRPRCPIDIAISEYGSLGLNDSNLDKIIEANDLHGLGILWLPAGTSVKIYE